MCVSPSGCVCVCESVCVWVQVCVYACVSEREREKLSCQPSFFKCTHRLTSTLPSLQHNIIGKVMHYF